MEMQVYVANLGKYNEGELVGAWFTPPIDFDELAEKIGLNNEYEEYAIHDYELPFDVDEYTPIAEINRLGEGISELEGTAIYEELKEIKSMWFNSFDELIDNKDDIISYSDCDSMEDVARYLIEELGQLGEVPANLQNYIDYQSLGRDMEIEGNFLVTSHGVFEYTN
ncbi:antirestriction protein ArdA [Enterococcus faecalis]|uniref:antirestriction protein ArdA n=1 Tax=Enterococcus TaxID=1350 RepID=UPI0015714563|nr:antirestriction protein ArdA [Enterococcus faecalis]EGO2712209.1 antirestriction protein ArdA [Enterococcus faecalis]EGO7802010.1 antirestriction protein ArdA [Enterococcus faecalis]EGO8493105.1 antirestriction protein ArdA [Enterococcus faecalis]EGO8667142.1 antirestriction protein ArdA [Enterococcus faecalis]MBJ1687128.1 antirestriction protein ArdA [Enterococcus faecalis]